MKVATAIGLPPVRKKTACLWEARLAKERRDCIAATAERLNQRLSSAALARNKRGPLFLRLSDELGNLRL